MSKDVNTTALTSKLYPIVSASLKSKQSKFKGFMSKFIDIRNKELFDIVPCSRLLYNDKDRAEFFDFLQIDMKKVQEIINETYYGKITNFNPVSAKDPTTVTILMTIRYFLLNKMQKEMELACIYLAFSGKMYPSVHYRSFPIEPVRYVMEYVVNNKLSNKFDIVSKGSVFGAVNSICNTWVTSYDDKIKSKYDEDMVYVIQQIHDRIGSFMINIAEVYYDAYENKEYITYDSDNLSEDDYHLADSDSQKAERVIYKAMEYINTNRVSYKICKMCSDNNIKASELQTILESILSNTSNMNTVKEFVSILVYTYFVQSKNKDVRDIDFINYSIAPKPNTKDPNILKMKNIIEDLLMNNSTAYIKRKSRTATKNSYYKAITMYFTLVIHYANK